MRILLLGDFSSLYANLKEGLREFGHDVILASNGDGWKNTHRDITLGSGSGLMSKITCKISPLLMEKKLTGYDIVQYINPFYFYLPYYPNRYAINRLINGNGRFFVSGAGDDAFFWRYGRKILKYGPFNDFLKFDLKKKKYYMESQSCLDFNKWLVDRSAGIIPIMYEYEAGYREHPKRLATLPIPVDCKKIIYTENVVREKLVVFHGLNRYGFKGTRHVEEAFRILKNKYPNDLDLVMDGHMPLDKYLDLMSRVNVVVDQTNSYSLGVNGVYALAMGKVVLGGAEPESLVSLGVSSSPVINITPSVVDIVKKIERVLECRKNIPYIGMESRRFAENNHGHIKVASSYLRIWEGAGRSAFGSHL